MGDNTSIMLDDLTIHHSCHCDSYFFFVIHLLLSGYFFCLYASTSRWLQGQPPRLAIENATGVQFLHLLADFIDFCL